MTIELNHFEQCCLAMKAKRESIPVHAGLLLRGMNPQVAPRKYSSFTYGDFTCTHDRGNMYLVACVRCGLKGTIAFPEDEDRKHCPACSKLPLIEWQAKGFASLLPKEPARKPLQASVDNLDEEEAETSSDDPDELSLEEKPLVAGAEEVEPDEIEPEEEDNAAIESL